MIRGRCRRLPWIAAGILGIGLVYSGPLFLLGLSWHPAVVEECGTLARELPLDGAADPDQHLAQVEIYRDAHPEGAPRVFYYPRHLVAAALLIAGLLCGALAREHRRRRGPGLRGGPRRGVGLVFAGLALLMIAGSVHMWSDVFDLVDQGLAEVSDENPLLADTKIHGGAIAAILLTAWMAWATRSWRVTLLLGIGALAVVEMALDAPLEQVGWWQDVALFHRVPLALFDRAFDLLHPELAGWGFLFHDDLLFAPGDRGFLVHKNVAAGGLVAAFAMHLGEVRCRGEGGTE